MGELPKLVVTYGVNIFPVFDDKFARLDTPDLFLFILRLFTPTTEWETAPLPDGFRPLARASLSPPIYGFYYFLPLRPLD